MYSMGDVMLHRGGAFTIILASAAVAGNPAALIGTAVSLAVAQASAETPVFRFYATAARWHHARRRPRPRSRRGRAAELHRSTAQTVGRRQAHRADRRRG